MADYKQKLISKKLLEKLVLAHFYAFIVNGQIFIVELFNKFFLPNYILQSNILEQRETTASESFETATAEIIYEDDNNLVKPTLLAMVFCIIISIIISMVFGFSYGFPIFIGALDMLYYVSYNYTLVKDFKYATVIGLMQLVSVTVLGLLLLGKFPEEYRAYVVISLYFVTAGTMFICCLFRKEFRRQLFSKCDFKSVISNLFRSFKRGAYHLIPIITDFLTNMLILNTLEPEDEIVGLMIIRSYYIVKFYMDYDIVVYTKKYIKADFDFWLFSRTIIFMVVIREFISTVLIFTILRVINVPITEELIKLIVLNIVLGATLSVCNNIKEYMQLYNKYNWLYFSASLTLFTPIVLLVIPNKTYFIASLVASSIAVVSNITSVLLTFRTRRLLSKNGKFKVNSGKEIIL